MTPKQARAARHWLQLNQPTVARRARVGLSTLQGLESGKPVSKASIEAVQQYFESEAIMFVTGFEEGTVFDANVVCDEFALINDPTDKQVALYALACAAVAQSGGRRPRLTGIAAAVVRADLRRRAELEE